MKKILGLDLGTNSIGWALVNDDEKTIEGMGSRIIPISQDILGKFDSGNSVSQTAERTTFRSVRRLRERQLLRRERIHRVLNIMGFLPEHYKQDIDFIEHPGEFIFNTEPKIAWKKNDHGNFEFLFQNSFKEMCKDFQLNQPQILQNNKKIPYDWTLYYLRKKALTQKIEKEELAWILLNFNQKRGYYQLRGKEEDSSDKAVEFYTLKVTDVTVDEPQKGKIDIWYNIFLENGWIYRRASKIPLFNWIGQIKEFIVTTEINEDGTIKKDKEGKEKRSFRAPSEDDWTLIKKKTEFSIENSNKTVGTYIYDVLLQNPSQKIKGKLIRTIERSFYRNELKEILNKQKEYHPELNDKNLFYSCVNELYPNNEIHRKVLQQSIDFTKLFIEDIIFYQRPPKSKKSLIADCKYEYRTYKNEEGITKRVPLKCVTKSHPLYQEFRLWKFVKDLKIYEREKNIEGKLYYDYDVTNDFIGSEEEIVKIFDWLKERENIKQDILFSSYFKIKKKKGDLQHPYRWNYVEDKPYLCNETHAQIKKYVSKVSDFNSDFLCLRTEMELWHILYSVTDKVEIEKALRNYAKKHNLPNEFADNLKRIKPFEGEYGSYSEKALKKLLPLMRMGKYWNYDLIDENTKQRIDKIITGEFDESIQDQVRNKTINLSQPDNFRALPEWLATYVVYNRHSEASEYIKWNSPSELEKYIDEFKQYSLRNPIVEQVVTETLRVVRDIWKTYGNISEIHIELGREMKNTAKKRAEITQKNVENENTNIRLKYLLAELSTHADVENVRPNSPNQIEILKIYEEGVLQSGIEIPDEINKILKSKEPSKTELIRYKLWLEQKYRSPYTGEMIPLSKLFTPSYQIEHIIPQSKYFDDSLSNKVICESVVNARPYKDNQLAYEFIANNEGRIIPELSHTNKSVKIFTLPEYEAFVKQNYGSNYSKRKKLLMAEIPDDFIERQLNDTRYISKYIKGLLSNIVREENEFEPTSKNVIITTGLITDTLKQSWGLNDIWNKLITPRFERLNGLTNSTLFGQWENKGGKSVFQINIPIEYQKGFNKKRIDHRHHAMDALVTACATRRHVNYLNNEAAKSTAKESRSDLRDKLCYKNKIDDKGNYQWLFNKPWTTFTEDTTIKLNDIVISFKQNLRVINKKANYYEHYVDGKKIIDRQVKGDNWAIRKPLHKDTVSGAVNLRFRKSVQLSVAIENWEKLVNKSLKKKISQLIEEGYDKKEIIKYFSELDYMWQDQNILKPEIYYFSDEKDPLVASRKSINSSFNSKVIESVTDSGIRKILSEHLAIYNEEKNGKITEHPELAFSPEGIDEMNKNIRKLNNGKEHAPICKVRISEKKGKKFNVGTIGNKKAKYVEAAKGTNLFFAVYKNKDEKRVYDTIPFNLVVERQKQGLLSVPETNEAGDKLLFFLSPNDLVYVPNNEEIMSGVIDKNHLNKNRIYKVVSSNNAQCFFIPHNVASPIVSTTELGANNKAEKSWNEEMIKEICVPLKINRLGNISMYEI